MKWDTKLIVIAVIGLAVVSYILKKRSEPEIDNNIYPAEAPTGLEEAETVDYPPPLFISKPALSPIWQNVNPYPMRIDYPFPVTPGQQLNLPAFQGHLARVLLT